MTPVSSILQALFPTTCACCGEVLADGERQVCLHCLSAMDATRYGSQPDNRIMQQLAGIAHLEAATAVYRFSHGGTVQAAVHALKFHSCPELGPLLGRQMGLDLLHSGLFDGVDLLVPVPLHWLRRLRRGYNQSELLCRGIAEVMPRPVDTAHLVRHRYTRQQSRQRIGNRSENVDGAFRVRRPEELRGKHLLLVDDVLTTGATLAACCRALDSVDDLRISIATLSAAC